MILEKKAICKIPEAKTTSYGIEPLPFRGNFLWNTLDDNINKNYHLRILKTK